MVKPKNSWALYDMTGNTGYPFCIMARSDWMKQTLQAFQETIAFIRAYRLQNLSLQTFSQSLGENKMCVEGPLLYSLLWSGCERILNMSTAKAKARYTDLLHKYACSWHALANYKYTTFFFGAVMWIVLLEIKRK